MARARQYEASGAFPGQATSALEALAYLHLLNGVTAQDAIAFARAAAAEPPAAGQGEDGGPGALTTVKDRAATAEARGRSRRAAATEATPAKAATGTTGPDGDIGNPGDDGPGGDGPGGGAAGVTG